MNCIDRLGAVKASISNLREEEATLKADLIGRAADHPGTAYAEDGDAFRVCVSWADKAVTNHTAVLADLAALYGIPQAVLERIVHRRTRVAPMVPTVRVSARTGSPS